MRFETFAVVLIVQEDGDGIRTLNDAVRVFADGRIEQLGWPHLDIHYASGTRIPTGASITGHTHDGKPVEIDVDCLGYVALNTGSGYGGDGEWAHGQWLGRDVVQTSRCSYTDPATLAKAPFGVIDHVARGTCEGETGYGLFEHSVMGRHAPTGFDDFFAVAP
jgi:hypothetical protein